MGFQSTALVHIRFFGNLAKDYLFPVLPFPQGNNRVYLFQMFEQVVIFASAVINAKHNVEYS
jgi:hypothetical protein